MTLFDTLRRSILPGNTRADATSEAFRNALHTPAKSILATKSLETASKACKEKVEKIAAECRRQNRRYRDVHFDFTLARVYCLHGLTEKAALDPSNSARVPEIFEEPTFFKNGATAGDIRQGGEGDCWFMAGVAAVTNMPGLLERICVARDEQVGVYGFIFFRDGEWCSVVIDDQLFLQYNDIHDSDEYLRLVYKDKEEDFNQIFLKGSSALSGAKCEDQNETWLPLLEKAYAKIHGDFSSIKGGYTGEGVEDLSGGVTTDVFTADILDRNAFWENELSKVNKEYLFAGWIHRRGENTDYHRQGVVYHHAYSVLRAVEAKGKRFVLLRNPWGKSEWEGPWSDGSSEWTAEWLQLLEHKFGDDGKFWMSYQDFLRKFTILDRTQLFDESWVVTEQRWLDYRVPWAAEYASERFELTVTKTTPTVIVLSQLDDRYFRGLEGPYRFALHFRIHKAGTEDCIMRAQANAVMHRSVGVHLDLEPGKYVVVFKVEAEYDEDKPKFRDIVTKHKTSNRKKFRQLAMNADLACAKAGTESGWREADYDIAFEAGHLMKYMEAAEEGKNGEGDQVQEGGDQKLAGGEGDGKEKESEEGDEKREGGKKEGREKNVDEKGQEKGDEKGGSNNKDDEGKEVEKGKGEEEGKKVGDKSKGDSGQKAEEPKHDGEASAQDSSELKPRDAKDKKDDERKDNKDGKEDGEKDGKGDGKKDGKKDEQKDKKDESKEPITPFDFLDPKLRKIVKIAAENYEWKARVVLGLKVFSKDPGLVVEVTKATHDDKDLVDLDDTTRDVQPEDSTETEGN